MKKQQLEKALAALFILVASACFVNLHGQVSITFPNDSVDAGGGATDGIQPLSLKFTINDVGVISLDATSKNINEDVQKVVNGWDRDTVGITDNAALFGKSFALVATTIDDVRLQCRLASGGGLGVRGKNQWRLDDGGAEEMYFTLFGDVGIEFTSIAYNDFNDDGGNGNFRLMDFDSDTTVYLDTPQLTGDSLFTLPDGAISMRYQTDTLTLTNSDTISTSTGNEGGRIWGFSFDVVEAMPMAKLELPPVPPLPTVELSDLELEFVTCGWGTTHLNMVMTDGQMLTFTLFVVFYVPCVATIAVMAKELGWRDTALISAFSVVVAVVVGLAGRLGYALFT